nr:hypothetical secreted protein [uncultured archaeon]
MNTNKKFVILLEILVVAFLVMSVVPVCGLSDSSADISAYPSIVNPGDEITVTYSGAPGFEFDGIAMFKAREQDIYEYGLGKVLYFLDGKKCGTLTITAPDEPGDYEFRLFEDDGYTDIARSNVVTVQEGTTVPTPTPTTLSGVHHLGDQTLSGWEVPKPEGTEYTTTFSLTAVPASADLILDVFNTDYNNPVLVNGNSIGILCISTIESWKQCTIKIPGSALRVGSNTLTIQSESRGGNYDDFMIRNIEVMPSSDAKPTPTPTTECGTFWVGVQEPWFDEHPESIIGKLETFDFDNDSSEDRIVYTFEPEEVAEDLFLVRTIEFNKTDSELFEGKIVLKFENKGDKPIEYSHIEEIPKSFAESVDDLVFSIPPDEIIDPDPKVRWNMWSGAKLMSACYCAWLEIHPHDYLSLATVFYGTLNYCVKECNERSGTSRDYCLLLLAEEFKAAEPTYVCHEIENEDLKNLCLGRVTGDKKYCEKIKNEDLRKLCSGQEEEEEEEVTTTPSTAPTITIPSGVHHLGDQTFTDWEVPNPEGTDYTITFSLATEPATSADLTLNVFQTNYNNPVLVNGQEVGFLCIHTSESWVNCTISIPGSALQIGSNTLTIRAGRRGTNYDDFMIKP